MASGTSCSDGDPCNGNETCNGAGTCQSGQPPNLDDGNPCTIDACSPALGITHVVSLGAPCFDACGLAHTCDSTGVCGAGPLDDQNPCTADSCDPQLGVVHKNEPHGALCDDGNACNGIAACNGFGACVQAPNAPDGTSCSDGNLCNGAETCQSGACVAGAAPEAGTACDDGNPCTEFDACDGSSDCVGSTPSSPVACDDGNPCTSDDVCRDGICFGRPQSGVPCGSGDACDGAATCSEGVCKAAPPPIVDDGDPTTLDTCDPSSGLVTHASCGGLDLTVATTLADMVRCLHTGPSPIQTGLTETIDPIRAAAIHGKVLDASGAPLHGVTVTLRKRTVLAANGPNDLPPLAPAGYGSTLTRADGAFDLALNGGTALLLEYSRPGYLSAQREVLPETGKFVTAPDVVLKPLDPAVTAVEVGPGSADIQVARGSVTKDARGTRQVTLLFQPGTAAVMTMPDGSQTSLPAGGVHVRATEYTVGPAGPSAMPASLPPSSAYTYAVELSLDEAVAAGATTVSFDPPVIGYLENFLGFPTGENVPSGAYRPDAGLWEIQQNGRVIKVVSVKDGVAALDIDDNPGADSAAALAAIGITAEEQQQLAKLYAPGQSLWRVPVAHFSAWDWNWGWGPPNGAAMPNVKLKIDNPSDDACTQHGSIIGCENRSLGEVFGVVGTPFSLHYQSDRTPGYKVPIHVPASGDTLPGGPEDIKVELDVAGQHQAVEMPPLPHTNVDFVWDGRNGLGQPVQGPQSAQISVGYEYLRTYGGSGSFGGGSGGGGCQGCAKQPSFGGGGPGAVSDNIVTATPVRITLWQRHRFALQHYNALYLGLGGLTLDVHHVYDPSGAVLYLGNGQKRSGDSLVTLSTFAGGGNNQASGVPASTASMLAPHRIAQGPDGSFYVAESTGAAAKIVRIAPDHTLTNLWVGPAGSVVKGIAVGLDGAILFSLASAHQVYRIPPDFSAPQVVVGTGAAGYYGPDGSSAMSAQLDSPQGLAVGPDGSIYIADTQNHQIRRVDPAGKIWRIAGFSFCASFKTSAECGDGGKASSASLNTPTDVVVGPDGTVYFTDMGDHRIRAITPDGIIHRVAGLAQGEYANNQITSTIVSGVPAKTAQLVSPQGMALAPGGALYFSDGQSGVIRRIDPPLVTVDNETSDTNGNIYTVAGTGPAGTFLGEGALATAASLPGPEGVAVTADGTLYFTDSAAGRVFRVRPAMPGLSLAKTTVVSEDGVEIYVFDENRRHEKTIDSMTGRVLYSFYYDADNLLWKVVDAYGRGTLITRDVQAGTVAVHGPFGQTTTLFLGADGYAHTIQAPDGTAVQLAYTASGSGLLSSLADPEGHLTTFTYDSNGRLISDSDPAGGSKTLATTLDDGVHQTISVTTTQSRVTTYQTDQSDPAVTVRKVTGPDGLSSTTVRTKLSSGGAGGIPPGQTKTTAPDGTTVTLQDAADPRLGFAAPYAQQITVATGGLTETVTRTRAVNFAANDVTSVTSLVDQTTVNNGGTWSSAYHKLADGTATWTRTTPLGRQGIATLDVAGHVVQMAGPGLAPLTVDYVPSGPNAGRVWHISQSDGQTTRTTTVAYDASGNVSTVTSPMNHVTQYQHDLNGRVTQTTTPDNRVFAFEHDPRGNVTAVLPPAPGGDHHFAYDARGLVSSSSPADLGPGDESTSYAYSFDGDSTLITLPSGAAIATTFDAAGRLTAVSAPSGATTLTYFPAIDPSAGKVSAVTSPDGVAQAFAYQGALTTDIAWTGPVTGTVHYTYDSQFRATMESVGTLAISRFWNADGQQTQAGDLQILYEASTGRFQGTSLGTVHDVLGWNAFGETTSYSASVGATTLLSRTYQRDAVGRIAQVVETLGGASVTKAYGYDLAGRLVDVSQDGTPIAHYTYDAHGNRTGTTYGAASPIEATFDAQDRLLTCGTTSYAHAITGERVSKTTPGAGTTLYGYDTYSQLTSVTLPGGGAVTYLYDAAGRRVAKKLDGAFVQRFVYGDAMGPAALVDATGNVLDRYVYATSPWVPDYLVRITGSQVAIYRLLKDERGSVRLVVDAATGAIAQQMDYDAFGRVLADTSPGFTPFGFAGGLWDADTGLVRFGQRDYDPEIGRWTTQDPIGLSGGDTDLYAYVGNDPINGVDPSGLVIKTENVAMNSALNDGLLAAIGFEQFAQGVYNWNNGVLELSNEGTFRQGIDDMRKGACQMLAGGLQAIQQGQEVVAAATMAAAVSKGWGSFGRPKSSNLPSWKRVKVATSHIASGHTPGGARTIGGTKDLFPPHMGPKEIESAVRYAYRYGERFSSQTDRVIVDGPGDGYIIRMVVNIVTDTIESAWPRF